MLKDQDAGLMRLGKLDNTGTDLLGIVFVQGTYFSPQTNVILLSFGDDAGLAAVACHASKLSLPKAVQLLASTNKAGGNHRAFDGLDSAGGEMVGYIEINRTQARLCVRTELLSDFGRCGELFFDRQMQHPAAPVLDQRWAFHLPAIGQRTALEADFHPGPTRTGPELEHDAAGRVPLPLSGIEYRGLVPTSWRNWWTNGEPLATRQGLLFLRAPLFQMAIEGVRRAKRRMNSRAAKHGGNIRWYRSGKRHHWRGVVFGRMGEPFQRGEGFFAREIKDARMGGNHLKIECGDLIKERFCCGKTAGMSRAIAEELPHGFRRARHCS